MTDLRTAAQQALEALVIGYDSARAEAARYQAAMAGYRPERHAAMDGAVKQITQAITALRAALAQQEWTVPVPEGLAQSDAEFWLRNRAAIIAACGAQGFTIVTTAHGVHLMRFGKIEAQGALAQQAEPSAKESSAVPPPQQAKPVAYLYHDAKSAHDANPLLHSTLLVLATDRRPEFRNETPLYTAPPAAAEAMQRGA